MYDAPDEDHCAPDSDEQLYRNPVYYEPARRILDLTQDDLGVPEEPGLLAKLLHMRDRIPVDKRGLSCPDCLNNRGRHVPMYLVQRDGQWFASHYRKPGDKPVSHESDEHLARKERVAKDCDDHGFHSDIESITANGLARLDVRIQGADGLALGYEPQLSLESTRTLRRRDGIRQRAKVRTMWDFVDPDHPGIGTVPYVRTPNLPASVIRVQKNPIAVRDGNYVLQEGRCTSAGAIVRCPVNYDPRTPENPAYCGRWHLYLTPSHQATDDLYPGETELTLTRFAVEAAAGARIPFQRDGLHGWLPADHWKRYLDAVGPTLEESPQAQGPIVRDGDRRDLCTQDRPPSDIRSAPKERRGGRTIILETRDQDEPEADNLVPPVDSQGHPISSCHICGRPASLTGADGRPEHWSCLTKEQQVARLGRGHATA